MFRPALALAAMACVLTACPVEPGNPPATTSTTTSTTTTTTSTTTTTIPEPGAPVINEFVANHVSTDTNEYLEVSGDASADYSAYSIVQVEGDLGAIGTLDSIHPVGATTADGYWQTGFLDNRLENGTMSLLLVRGLTGTVGTDLDTNDDGALDVSPWSSMADSVAVNDGGVSDRTYGTTVLGVAYDGAAFAPGGASRLPDGADTDMATDWVRNDFDLAPIQPGTPTVPEALNTPGALNEAVVAAGPVLPLINEVDADTPGTDVAEFLEIYADPMTDLSGSALVFYNGSNDQSYKAIDLDGQTTDANGYFVVCGNAANVTGCDLDVTPDSDLIQNGQDAVALYQADATAFPNGTAPTSTGLLDAVVYDTADADDPGLLALTPGQPQIDEAGGGDQVNQSIQRCPDGEGGRLVTTAFAAAVSTAGTPNSCGSSPGTVTKISAVQGSRPAPDPAVDTPSPSVGDTADDPALLGQQVTIEGVVVGVDDLAGQSNAGAIFHNDRGVFVQEEDADADADPTTSEGIFVQFETAGDSVTPFPPGTKVRATGTVRDHFELTALDTAGGAAGITVLGTAALPTATLVDASTVNRNRYEQLEGMRVALPPSVANSGGTNKFGELFLTPGTTKSVLLRNVPAPGLLAIAADAGAGNPTIPRKAMTPSSTYVRADLFATVSNVVGPLTYTFDKYAVLPQVGAGPTVVNDPSVPYPLTQTVGGAGEVRIASFNVENFFGVGADFDGSPVSVAEYAEKRDRIVDAVDRLLARPDIVGVAEVADIASLNAVASQLGDYTAYLVPGNDNRGIDVGFLVKSTVTVNGVTQVGLTAANPTASTCSDVSGRLFDRPPLRLDATVRGSSFSVFMNHFSSKAAPDTCRDAQAAFVRDQVATIEAGGGEAIVTGDLNAFEDESPLAVLDGSGTSLDNLWDTVPAGQAYSFQFDGRLQTLDHILVTDGLAALVTGMTYAHFDNNYFDRYETSSPPASADGHRVSDHDPPVVTLAVP